MLNRMTPKQVTNHDHQSSADASMKLCPTLLECSIFDFADEADEAAEAFSEQHDRYIQDFYAVKHDRVRHLTASQT